MTVETPYEFYLEEYIGLKMVANLEHIIKNSQDDMMLSMEIASIQQNPKSFAVFTALLESIQI